MDADINVELTYCEPLFSNNFLTCPRQNANLGSGERQQHLRSLGCQGRPAIDMDADTDGELTSSEPLYFSPSHCLSLFHVSAFLPAHETQYQAADKMPSPADGIDHQGLETFIRNLPKLHG